MNISLLLPVRNAREPSTTVGDVAHSSGGVSNGLGQLMPDAMIDRMVGSLIQTSPDRLAVLVAAVRAQRPLHEWAGRVSDDPQLLVEWLGSRVRWLSLSGCDVHRMGEGITGLLRGAKRTESGGNVQLKVSHHIEGMVVSMAQYEGLKAAGMDARQWSQLSLMITSGQELEQYGQLVADWADEDKPPILWIDHTIELAGQSLRGMNLSGCDLANRKLDGCDLSGACLTNTQLMGASLRNVILDDAELSGANLTNACVEGARFDRSDLSDATVMGLDITADQLAACFDFANLRMEVTDYERLVDSFNNRSLRIREQDGAVVPATGVTDDAWGMNHEGQLENDTHEDPVELRESDLDDTRLIIGSTAEWQRVLSWPNKPTVASIDSSVSLSGCPINGVNMPGINLEGRACSGAIFNRVCLEDARLANGELNNATVHLAILSGADLTSCQGCGLSLHTVDMRGAILKGGIFFGARFETVNLSGAVVAGAVFYRAHFDGVVLTDVVLSGMDLTEVAVWKGVTLRHAQLIGTRLSRAQWEGCVDVHGAMVSVADYRNVIDMGVSPDKTSALRVVVTSPDEVRAYLQLDPLPRLKLDCQGKGLGLEWEASHPMPLSLYMAWWAYDPDGVSGYQMAIPDRAKPSLKAQLDLIETDGWVDPITQRPLTQLMADTPLVQLMLMMPSAKWEGARIVEESGIRRWITEHESCPYTRQVVMMDDVIPLTSVIQSLATQYPDEVNATHYPRVWRWMAQGSIVSLSERQGCRLRGGGMA